MTEREMLLDAVAKAKSFKSGQFISLGALYELQVTAQYTFTSRKNVLKAVAEFKVLKTTPLDVEANYQRRGRYPNQVGSSCTFMQDMIGGEGADWGPGLFRDYLCALVNVSSEELTRIETVAGKEVRLLHELLPDGPVVPSPCVGLRVMCEAFEGTNKAGQPSPRTRWNHIPNQGHPLVK